MRAFGAKTAAWMTLLCACGRGEAPSGAGWFREVETAASSFTHAPDDRARTAALGAGVSAGDLDGDGLPELVVAGALHGIRIYKNRGGLRFEDMTGSSGVDGAIPAQAVALADLDNDGDRDLIVAALDRLYVFENTGGGRFRDVSSVSGAVQQNRVLRGIQVADFDNDGLLDLFLMSTPNSGDLPSYLTGNLLYLNRGALAFEDRTSEYGVAGEGASLAAVSVDYDLDGKLDLFVANDAFSANFGNGRIVSFKDYPMDALWRNVSPGTPSFREMSGHAMIAYPRSSMGIIVADFNGDGRPDFYVSDYGEKSLFINRTDGTFDNQATEYGLGGASTGESDCSSMPGPKDCLLVSWGSALFDADLDGEDDLFVVNGSTFWAPQATLQYRGRSGAFMAFDAGLPKTQGRTLVASDLDADGDVDLVVGTLGGPARIFENVAPHPGANWLRVELAGTSSNRDGAGAIVTATFDGKVRRRFVGAGGVVHGYSNEGAHFGLGPAQWADIDVAWPDGTATHEAGVSANQVVRIAQVRP